MSYAPQWFQTCPQAKSHHRGWLYLLQLFHFDLQSEWPKHHPVGQMVNPMFVRLATLPMMGFFGKRIKGFEVRWWQVWQVGRPWREERWGLFYLLIAVKPMHYLSTRKWQHSFQRRSEDHRLILLSNLDFSGCMALAFSVLWRNIKTYLNASADRFTFACGVVWKGLRYFVWRAGKSVPVRQRNSQIHTDRIDQ